jgi:arylsulfatase A-like enzyme/Flp pilus assembly protein TadD
MLVVSIASTCGSQPPIAPSPLHVAMTVAIGRCACLLAAFVLGTLVSACAGDSGRFEQINVPAEHLVLITIDTLRADRVGAYGYVPAQTPAIDRLAREGARFTNAFSTAPITLPAHASLLTGRYPPGHGSRHNGLSVSASVPTLATSLEQAGFATAAFVSAFPLDKRFGLARGFDVYDDELPRGADRKPMNERAGDETVRRAVEWLASHEQQRTFLWLHLFEPHAPYGEAASERNVSARYDDEVATADRAVARLLQALGARADSTLIVLAADHGEAFGEHGEIGHSIFVYDTTLQIPLVIKGPGVPASREVAALVSLVDVAPTALALLGVTGFDADGVSLVTALETGAAISDRVLYAESFAPLLDFGWSPLRSVRDATWKYIAAPRPELYEVADDPGESADLAAKDPQRAARLLARVEAFSGVETPSNPTDSEAVNRLRSLGYVGSGSTRSATGARADPKDRIQVASRMAEVTSGEVRGETLLRRLEAILREDPENPQAHLRLGYAEIERGRCDRAEPHLQKALAARIPSADAGLALADCRGRSNDLAGASRALEAARELEPGNPVVEANLGLLALAQNDTAGAIRRLESALAIDPALHQARFALARALGRAGRRADAANQARTLLELLPPDAPQRAEVQRLLDALR